AFFNIAGQVLGDGTDPTVVCFLLHIIQFHVQSCLCANLRDAGTHLSGANDHYVLNRHAYFASLGTSIMIASPCPPPEQMAAIPMPPPRRFNSYANVRIMRAPLAPIGCPSATDPPLTFTFSASKSAIFERATATAANASLISNKSMSSSDLPVFFNNSLMTMPGVSGKRCGSIATSVWD